MVVPNPSPAFAGIVCLVLTLCAIGAGYLGGKHIRTRIAEKAVAPIGAVVAAILGLLAFTLGFTFNIAANRFESRRSLVLSEANALGTLYLRAQILPSPYSTLAEPLIRQYIGLRGSPGATPEQLLATVAESEKLHKAMWQVAIDLAQQFPTSEIAGLFVSALNEVIDLHTSRITVGLTYRVPTVIWITLGSMICISMVGVGYQLGLADKLHLLSVISLSLSFTLVIVLIADLDHPYEGLLRVSQQPLSDLYNSIK